LIFNLQHRIIGVIRGVEPSKTAREPSPFVTITIEVAIGWLFEDGYAKEAARYFQTARNSFRTMLKKLPYRCMLNVRTNGECSQQQTILVDFKRRSQCIDAR